MGHTFQFLNKNGELIKTLDDKMLDEEKTKEFLNLRVNETVALGSGYEKQVYRVKNINRTSISAAASGKGEDETCFEYVVEII